MVTADDSASLRELLADLADERAAVGVRPATGGRAVDRIRADLVAMLGAEPHDEIVDFFTFVDRWAPNADLAPSVGVHPFDDYSIRESFLSGEQEPGAGDVGSAVFIRDGASDWIFAGGDGTGFEYALSPARAGGPAPRVLMFGEGSFGIHVVDPDGRSTTFVDEWSELPMLRSWIAAMLAGYRDRTFAIAASPLGVAVQVDGATADTSSRALYPWPGPVPLPAEGAVVTPRFALDMAQVQAVDLSPDKTRVLTGGIKGEVKLWDTQTGTELAAVDSGYSRISRVEWSPSGDSFLVSGAYGRGIAAWNAATLSPAWRLADGTGQWSPDGRLFLAFKDQHTAVVVNASMTERLLELDALEFRYFMGWSPDGSHLLFQGEGNRRGARWHVVSAATGTTVLRRFIEHAPIAGSPPRYGWSPDSRWFAFVDGTGMTLWNAEHGSSITLSDNAPTAAAGIEWSPDSKLLAVARSASTEIWSVDEDPTAITAIQLDIEGEAFAEDELSKKKAPKIAWSPDGTRLVSTSAPDRAARIHDVQTGATLHLLEAFPLWFSRTLRWSPTGRYLLSDNIETRIWDAETGLITHSLDPDAHAKQLWGTDDTFLIGLHGHVRRWDLTHPTPDPE